MDTTTLEGNFKLKMRTPFHPVIFQVRVRKTQHPGEFTAKLGVSEERRAANKLRVPQGGNDG